MSSSSLSSVSDMTSRDSTPANDLPTPKLTPKGKPTPATPRKHLKKESIPALKKHKESKGAKHLDKVFTKSNGLFFDSFTTATNAVGQAQWQPPANDSTIPQTVEQEQEIVRRLYDSFRDIVTAHDTENSAYRKRFLPGTENCYEPWTIEACAWEILVSHLFAFTY